MEAVCIRKFDADSRQTSCRAMTVVSPLLIKCTGRDVRQKVDVGEICDAISGDTGGLVEPQLLKDLVSQTPSRTNVRGMEQPICKGVEIVDR